MIPSIPVFILCGFLGAGKTTLLNYILYHQTTHKIAIIENEFGNIAIDTSFLSNSNTAIHITTLKNGCICCNSHAELEVSLKELLDQLDRKEVNFTQLIIECTGMADPSPILRTFLTHEIFSKRFDIKGTITIVDAINALYHFKHFNVTQAQIAMADLILLSKTDLSTELLEPLVNQIQHMNKVAPIYNLKHGQLDLKLLDELNFLSPKLSPKSSLFSCVPIIDDKISYDTKVNSFVIHRKQAFDADKLSRLINKILKVFEKQLIRYKGIFNIQHNPHRLIFQGVQQIYNSEWGEKWNNTEDRYSEIVFIGVKLPEEEFHYFFNKI
ncbi:GTP-binding protein [Commensalibacter papalotli (ex Botero et al. 2024)]|uniref:G3E family (YejR) (PDB:1NIJ) (PUBMED:19822009) n=1 Tax=Commensalibacter papalotli (ex Botero et al. 2024) TaxID=2972766 RepID=A0ABM9HPT6_9PROT|nr:GTP-binding protein [Commensalibacter papalotli (ex Botero et al. 2024)]CAI3932598.1 G3E family (YejR) (PDB:1NIJ) (PUBMED:19822009 [Commensalibacter papalotli (ex Botero et al. 2024)]CAI3943037.1 G3E family (YejR) (PDB:1NIJ) (PUBMED:19822009 [Commensalibacter papalotli (ex Botero et al. 2024)]